MQPTGLLLYPKPSGVTSHDIVCEVRRRFERATKVGHAGTLDPLATGLLLVLVGQATRTQRYFNALSKTYRVNARLGWLSDTGDREGNLTHTGRIPQSLAGKTGAIWQRPPAYSAVKVEGQPLYRRARRGERADAPLRAVHVYRFDCLWHSLDRAGFEIACSAGTYVRSLVEALEDAYCESIERTAVGPFRLEDADPARLLPLESALCFLPERRLTASEAEAVAHGRDVELEADDQTPELRLTYESKLVALAERTQQSAHPRVVFGL